MCREWKLAVSCEDEKTGNESLQEKLSVKLTLPCFGQGYAHSRY